MNLTSSMTGYLNTSHFGRRIVELDEVESTNDEALRRAREGFPEGGVVIANHQTKGRGRFSRQWLDEPGKNLTLSVVLFPEFPTRQFGLIGLAAALAIVQTIEQVAPACRPDIKWPNDVRIDGLKTAGILVETSHSVSGNNLPVVLGIGFNVNQRHFPEELSRTATSLYLSCGVEIDRGYVLSVLLAFLESWYDTLQNGNGERLRSAFESRVSGLGDMLEITPGDSNTPVSGRFIGIDTSGAIRLETSAGERTFHAGDVTLRNSRQ